MFKREIADVQTRFQFSSPIGAFIFLIDLPKIEGSHILHGFSSPIGAFIFLIVFRSVTRTGFQEFSSPIGAFIFLILEMCM